MKIRTLVTTVAALTVPAHAFAEGTSPWLPIPGELSLTLNYSEQSGDDAYIGDQEIPLSAITGGGASEYERNTTILLASYGISDALAVDVVVGYGDVEIGDAESDSGITDSIIGLSWRVVDEYVATSWPTVTLHGAAIINGDYDGGRLAALGNDSSGFELSVLAGKQITDTVSLSAEIGHQNRSGDVPDAHFVHLGANFQIADKWGLNIGYAVKKYSGDLDIGGPGFSPSRFQEINAERELVKFGIGYAISANQGIALNFATILDGRNTVKDDKIIGISYTYSIPSLFN